MITKEWLDKFLPDLPATYALVGKFAGISMPAPSGLSLRRGLLWLANFTEKDRHPRREDTVWGKADPYSFQSETLWPISMAGLEFKQSMQYLTAQGWPSGMGLSCWFVRIEYGHYEYAGGETPELAVARAVIIMAVMKKHRDEFEPDKRPHLTDLIERVVTERMMKP